MLATLAKLALAATVLVLFVPSADAQRVHPRCVNSKDKVRCSCWLSNGASRVIRPDGRVRIRTNSQWDMDRIIACMRRHGRPNG